MNILILSARTGNGHTAVSRAVKSMFEICSVNQVHVFEDFYEQLSPYTTMMSDFYNLLQMRSKNLCKIFTELACLENEKKQNDIYNLIKDGIEKHVQRHKPDIIISATPLINRYIIRFLDENASYRHIKFYVVITDPFIPMYPGFDVIGADGYFCPNELILDNMLSKGLPADRLYLSGFAINRKHFLELSPGEKQILMDKYKFKKDDFVVLINSGHNGSYHFIRILEKLLQVKKENEHIVFLCGSNDDLYKMVTAKFKDRVTIIYYEENLHELMSLTHLCITKPGANTIYECINKNVPILVDAIDGLLYQESGIKKFLKKAPIGEIVDNYDSLNEIYAKMCNSYGSYKSAVTDIPKNNGAYNIVQKIMSDNAVLLDKELEDICHG